MKKKEVIAFIIISMFIVPSVSAGFFDFFKKNFGFSPSQNTEITLEVGNVAPQIINVQSLSPQALNANPDATNIFFNFTATDQNAIAELSATGSATFTKSGDPTIRTGTCTSVQTNPTDRIYQCNVTMRHFDAPLQWNINVTIQDVGGLVGENSTTSFFVQTLKDISLSPTSIAFPQLIQGNTNRTSLQNTTITNNGNYIGSINITAFDLRGESTPTETIPAANFKAAGASENNVCANGNTLGNNTITGITSTLLNRGLTGNTEQIQYCITLVPVGISSQIYSARSVGGNAWSISI